MNRPKSRLRELLRTLGITAAALLVVAAVLVAVGLYAPRPGPERPSGRSTPEADSVRLARKDAPASRPDRAAPAPSQPREEGPEEGRDDVADGDTPGRDRGEEPSKGDDLAAARPDPIEPDNSAPPAEAAPAADDRAAAARAEYEAKKAKAPDTADAQTRLALWCERRGLKDEAKAHWEAVARLNPKSETARKRLGYRKYKGRWMTDAMIAEAVEQAAADKRWLKDLEDVHKRLHSKAKSDEAEAELAALSDPRAVPTIWKVFAGDARHHLMVAGLLGRLASPQGSRGLAALAVYSQDPKARKAAADALRDRDPAEFAEALVGLIGPMLKYKVQPVPGHRDSKMLLVEGEQFNRQLLYAVPTPGQAGASNPFGACSRGFLSDQTGKTGHRLAQEFNRAQARLAAEAARQQLQSDVATIGAINASIRELNARAVGVLNAATGQRIGEDRESWKRWLAARLGRTYVPPAVAFKPTFAQVVPPLYQPTFVNVPAPT